MSTTRTGFISARTKLDEQSATILRSFDIEWRCGTRFIQALLEGGCPADLLGSSLRDALFSYRIMCQQGIGDFDRLLYVLSRVFAALKGKEQLPEREQLVIWFNESLVPTEIQEYLLNG